MIKNNKGFTAFIAAIIVFFLGFIVYIRSTDTGEPENPADSVTIEESVNKVTVDEVRENIDKKDKYVFILGDDNCHGCIMLKNNLKKLVAEEDVQLDYIDLQVVPQADVEQLLADLEYDISQGLSTPTTFIIENGEMVDTVVGAVAVEDLLDMYGDFILEDSSSEQEQAEENTETSEEVTEEE